LPFPEKDDFEAYLDGFPPNVQDIAHTEREIALMQEYRTRLTADVVTGKLDLRPAATDEAQEELVTRRRVMQEFLNLLH